MASRKERLEARRKGKSVEKEEEEDDSDSGGEKKKDSKKSFYYKYYKELMIIPFLLLLLAIGFLGYNYVTTGAVINKGISLQGGITITVPVEEPVSLPETEGYLNQEVKQGIKVRELSELGVQKAILVEVPGDVEDMSELSELENDVVSSLESKIEGGLEDYSVETIGPSLGRSFFQQTIKALIFAFIFMGGMVFLYFRTFAPSIAVILAAFSDIVVTMAIVNVIGMEVGTSGIAAFLMLIGYSVDTDILLTTKVLRRKEGTIYDRVLDAMKTGLTMNGTTLAAITIGIVVSQSEVITQIMIIIFIGLLVDMINTWIQNVGILRWYAEGKEEYH